ncbi:MAG: hypothetical protein E7388_01745 [Ruminococcaceae bacterium]|nr:hypothetical protein [Oscillospiraceae bacterium]
MQIEDKYNPLFGFTQISDLFFTDYLPELDGVSTQLYILCLYFNKRGKEITREELAAGIKVTPAVIDEKLISLENAGLLVRKENRIILQDINQKELERCYRSRTTGAMSDEFTIGRKVVQKRVSVAKSISDKFFGGNMPVSWYQDIDLWFDKYNFEPEVMFMLFQHCVQYNALTKPYVRRVADDWGRREIRTPDQLEKYLTEYDLYKTNKGKVIKKLGLNPTLDEYSEYILKRWFLIYKYDFETIEVALRNATKKKNVGLNYFDAIVTDWYKKGLRDKASVLAEAEQHKASNKGNSGAKTTGTAQKNNYQERAYDDDFLQSLYKDAQGDK